MTAVTQPKTDIRHLIHKEMIQRYQGRGKQQREDLFLAVVMRYSGTMTLRELEKWHFALYPPSATEEKV